jgi:hypothetical protein
LLPIKRRAALQLIRSRIRLRFTDYSNQR